MAQAEQTGWRDLQISARHRTWGANCPAVDLDFVLVEYYHGRPCALVEYKRAGATWSASHPTYRALCDLADQYRPGALPCWVAVYRPGQRWRFVCRGLNDAGREALEGIEGREVTEAEYVRRLLEVRTSTLTEEDRRLLRRLEDAA